MMDRSYDNPPISIRDQAARANAFEAELVRAARAYPVDTETVVRNAHAALARRRRWHAGIAAASLVAAAVASLWLLRALWTVHEIQTGAGQWMTVTLEDSTEVRLGPHSQVRFDYDDDRRTVVVESGRALFQVSKDRRPFLVRVHQIDAQALGTTFAVSLRSDEAVTLTVQEGRVAVSPRDSPAEMLYLSAGEEVEVARAWPVAPRHVDDVASELAWAHKRLTFRVGDTLASAVAEFNSLNAIQIRIDQQLASRPIRGDFDASDPVSFAQTVGGHADNIVLSRTADTVRLEVKEHSPGETAGGPRDDG
jgi:transmembrane sensor